MFFAIRTIALTTIAAVSLLGGAGQARADTLDSPGEPMFSTISWATGNDNSPTLPTSPGMGIAGAVSCTVSGAQSLNMSLLSLQTDSPNAIEVNFLEDDVADDDVVLSR